MSEEGNVKQYKINVFIISQSPPQYVKGDQSVTISVRVRTWILTMLASPASYRPFFVAYFWIRCKKSLAWLPLLDCRSAKNDRTLSLPTFPVTRGVINPSCLTCSNMNCCICARSNLLLMWKCHAVSSICTEPELLSWTKVHIFAPILANNFPF